jgi:hypothetical protein
MKDKRGNYKKPTLKQKVEMYENVFNQMYLCRNYSLNDDRYRQILDNINIWSRMQGMEGPYQGEERNYYNNVYGSFWNLLNDNQK